MKIICAGLPKTGTKTVAAALGILGYRVYDFDEQWAFQKDEFIQAFSGKKMPDFYKMYSNIDAIIDVPGCLFYKEIFQAFPQAKVILVLRDDAEMWTSSMLKTCKVFEASFQKMWAILAVMFTPSGRKVAKLWPFVKRRLALEGGDRRKLCELYEKHNEEVRSCIPSHQLLVMNIKEGWKPLCQFLGHDIPECDFPCLNVDSSYVVTFLDKRRIGNRMYKELVALGALLVIVLAFAMTLFFNIL